ncbi:hypothetical protein HO173_003184 [Letharia columbiana]|uniref:Uncharacterized protein n=1 Tax=Letharia columbiana TaxID=112416 RepID=A0A8H6L7S8_9LECA|nr:uncharacterized protein HO173_003184 [Letharia columbiana]KAF6238678.1 hypothetical protein HO173_003184 [Letharia columbiana]
MRAGVTSDTLPATPKKVPPTPNVTPASTPATSATNSPATILSDSIKKTKKTREMARQHASRPEKRHPMRWTDESDKKLLLAM